MSLEKLLTSSMQKTHPKRRFFLLIAGITLLYTVSVSFFYATWLLKTQGTGRDLFSDTLEVSIILTTLAFVLWIGLQLPFKRLVCLTIGFTSLSAALILVFVAVSLDLPFWVVNASAAFAGIGIVLTVPVCYAELAPYEPGKVAFAFGCMFLGGMVASILLELLPLAISFALHVVALVGSVGCLASALRITQKTTEIAVEHGLRIRKESKKAPSRRDYLDAFLVPAAYTLALSIAYVLLKLASKNSSLLAIEFAIILQLGGAVAALVFLLHFRFRKNSSSALFFNIVFGILAAGIFFLPFLSSNYSEALTILAATGWKFSMLSLFYLVVVTFADNRKRLLIGISLAYALPRLGLYIGTNIAFLIKTGITDDFMRMIVTAFFLLYLILIIIWVANSHERKKSEAQAKAAAELFSRLDQDLEDVRALRCQVLGEEHGLTNREQEILSLIAQGRDTEFVGETLYLSTNTVKSYRKSIYKKLSVHSKQEIINLINNT